ncbi:MAG: pyridoxal phosphate-dependent aminotransferase [Herpetosiphonaceae bacterium]|nr:pyridoxal phosphate-dependent aminotransferase [Herpetosiphonaceae bacterium]
MTGFWADGDLSPNLIEQARIERSRQGGYLDLTSSNPTAQGLLFPPALLREAADGYWAKRLYQPDPHGQPAARRAIQGYYATRSPVLRLDLNAIFITASTSEAYSLLFALLCAPGDNVLGPHVTYPLFEYLAAVHHIELRPYQLDETRGWAVDETSVRAAADARTRAVLLISPHNPTGMIIQQPLAVLNQLALPVICDEVFAPFTYRADQTPPLGALHPAVPVFHLNGISKLFALPDLKLGWIALSGGAAEQYGERLELLNDTFLGSNSLTQHMLPQLFEHGLAFVQSMRDRVAQNIDWALQELADHAEIEARPPDGGYYLFLRLRSWSHEEALVLYLIEHGVLTHPGFFYGDVPGVHLMVSALTEPTTWRAGITQLSGALRA